MKYIVFFCLLLFIVNEAFGSEKVCDPGTRWQEKCNDCFCTLDGTGKACTKKACSPEEDGMTRSVKAKVCEPKTNWKEKCNTCFCNDDGTAAGCTYMGCLEDNPPVSAVPEPRTII